MCLTSGLRASKHIKKFQNESLNGSHGMNYRVRLLLFINELFASNIITAVT